MTSQLDCEPLAELSPKTITLIMINSIGLIMYTRQIPSKMGFNQLQVKASQLLLPKASNVLDG